MSMSTTCKTGALSSVLLLAGMMWAQPALAAPRRMPLYDQLMAAKAQLDGVLTGIGWVESAIQDETANVTRLDAEFRRGADPVAIGRELEEVAARVDIIDDRTTAVFAEIKPLRALLFKIKTEAHAGQFRWIYGQAVLMLDRLDVAQDRTETAWYELGRLHEAIQRLRDDIRRR